jgi:ATP-binding cassette subfamily C protein
MLLINQKLLSLAKGMWHWIFLIVLIKLFIIAGIITLTRIITDLLGGFYLNTVSVDQAIKAIALAFIVTLITAAGNFMTGEGEYRCTAAARIRLRHRIYKKILELDVEHMDKIRVSKALVSAVDGVEAIEQYFSKYLPSLIYCLVAPIIMFLQMQSYSFSAAVILCLIAYLILPVSSIFSKIVQILKNEYWTSFTDLNSYYLESLDSLNTLKLFNQDAARLEKLHAKADVFNKSTVKVMGINFRSTVLTDSTIYGGIAIVILLTAFQLKSGKISLSPALGALMLSYSFFESVRLLMSTAHLAFNGIASAQNIAELMEIDSSRPSVPPGRIEENREGIVLEDVSFQYDGRKQVLSNIGLRVKPGQTTAIVGESGSGKSTVAGLMMRFLDPAGGKLFLNGREYFSYPIEELRKMICIVPQNTFVFSGTIADNLRLAKPDAAFEEMYEVCKMVQLSDFIDKQPKKLDSDVGDAGTKLSGGQRQKIGIARALLTNAEFCIFDEATSNVDAESEADIWACIENLARRKTLIVISHRLSTIRNADCIYVMDSGCIAESGTHQELVRQSGIYSHLVREQEALESYKKRSATV